MLRRHTTKSLRSDLFGTVWFVAAILVALPAVAQKDKDKADEPDPANVVEGEIKSVEKKGRTLVLSIETESGETNEQILTTRTPVIVKAEGDAGFLRPGAVVYTEAFQNTQNKKLFGKKFKVYLDGSRQRGWKQGETKEVIEVIGPIVKTDEKELTLDLGRAGPGIIQKEDGFKVNIETSDRDLITAGAKVKLHGKSIRDRFRVTAVEVNLEKPVDSKEYFAAKEENSKGRRNRSRSGSKSAKKSESSDTGAVENPFEEIDKK